MKSRELISDAIDAAVNCGWYRAHKHNDKPSEDYIKSEMVHHVSDAFYDLIDTLVFQLAEEKRLELIAEMTGEEQFKKLIEYLALVPVVDFKKEDEE
jgi:hypothetical protein